MSLGRGVRSAKAWLKIIEAGRKVDANPRQAIEQYMGFYKSNIMSVLEEEKFFDYLNQPRSQSEIIHEFGYSNEELLNHLLNVLKMDNLLKIENSMYKTVHPLKKPFQPEFIPSSLTEDLGEAYLTYIQRLPDRLKGKTVSFTHGPNVFNWDAAMENYIMYSMTAKAAMIFSQVGKEPVKLLDAGCRTGVATAILWDTFRRNNCFYPRTPMKIVGIDGDENFIEIGKNEFQNLARRIMKETDKSFNELSEKEQEEKIEELSEYFPTFQQGDVENLEDIPDNSFDMVYASNILHWTDISKSLPELLRVVRPGGKLFGASKIRKPADKIDPVDKMLCEYTSIVVKIVNQKATGFPERSYLKKIALGAGAKEISTGTVLGLFNIKK